MDSRERNGNAHVPAHVVIAHDDVHRAVLLVPPDWRVGAGTNLERAPLNPVRLLDVCKLPEFIGGSPDVQFLRLALQLDHSGVVDIIASLDGHVHHGLILAATKTWAKRTVRFGPKATGHATGTGTSEASRKAFEICS